MEKTRIETDSLGAVEVPQEALYGAQTQRAVNHFQFSGRRMPDSFIAGLAHIKWAAAQANAELGTLPKDIAESIIQVVQGVIKGEYNHQFPVDVFQTGSGTSTNMNMNEVLAHLATSHLDQPVHPNDHVNCSQSSNDVIPSSIHVSAVLQYQQQLKPALEHLIRVTRQRADGLDSYVKTGRTHLMDAMPLTLGQELNTWAFQLEEAQARLEGSLSRLMSIGLGGTAIGTGINAHPQFAQTAVVFLSNNTGCVFTSAKNLFSRISAMDNVVEFSGQLKTLAVALMKISNDLRWMNSGPLAGLSEIELKALQPGSSIMPGKVNPVIPEAVCMVSARVMGNDTSIAVAGQSGNFQLNVMLPLIADSLLESLRLLEASCCHLADLVIDDFKVNKENIQSSVAKNPILVTALNPIIGYEKAAAIAKQAYKEGKPIIEVAASATSLSEDELGKLLDPRLLSYPHVKDREI